MKMLSLDDAIKAVTMLLDDTDGIDKIRSCDVINNLKYAPSVEEIEPAQKWISVKDRLPEEHKLVLATDETFYVHVNWIVESKWIRPFHNRITYWMTIPNLPKEVDDDET